VCLGLPHTPSEHIQLEDNKLLREQHGYKVRCVAGATTEERLW
jgi:hypothetical protein